LTAASNGVNYIYYSVPDTFEKIQKDYLLPPHDGYYIYIVHLTGFLVIMHPHFIVHTHAQAYIYRKCQPIMLLELITVIRENRKVFDAHEDATTLLYNNMYILSEQPDKVHWCNINYILKGIIKWILQYVYILFRPRVIRLYITAIYIIVGQCSYVVRPRNTARFNSRSCCMSDFKL